MSSTAPAATFAAQPIDPQTIAAQRALAEYDEANPYDEAGARRRLVAALRIAGESSAA